LVPAVGPGRENATLKVLGTILSHGYMVCGYLPIRVAFPVIAAALNGPDVSISDALLINCFLECPIHS